ncbi:hypothetical protein PPACK8108_LOCUS6999 [Phakopsora pachyrhizi]|uniref:Uncharacterized protein n=1 Tax=Phakopsora pachyrhizi TaxID=170000 RepID=A0AAV0ATQ5_PHAPC|nr:hypothetical protein PPACK8108_LOCUS6999 [Phakopsora pachyrhizi]
MLGIIDVKLKKIRNAVHRLQTTNIVMDSSMNLEGIYSISCIGQIWDFLIAQMIDIDPGAPEVVEEEEGGGGGERTLHVEDWQSKKVKRVLYEGQVTGSEERLLKVFPVHQWLYIFYQALCNFTEDITSSGQAYLSRVKLGVIHRLWETNLVVQFQFSQPLYHTSKLKQLTDSSQRRCLDSVTKDHFGLSPAVGCSQIPASVPRKDLSPFIN